jgi:2-polyprenyl-3-methyl-5-hydroxy-6-metoxy-1,4-benzoquinol methylase
MENLKDNPVECRLCKARVGKFEIVGDFVYGGSSNQKFYHCSMCDIAFLYPPMTEKKEKDFYAGEFEKYMEKRAGKDFDWSGPEAHIKSNEKQYKRRLRFFQDLILPGKRILEIGCSSGFMLLPLKKKGLEAVGIEPSGGFTSFLTGQDIPVYSSLDELGATKLGKKKFDLLFHFFVLEHVRNPVEFLKQAFKFVAPGGHMVFEVPSRSDPLISIYNIPAFQKFYWSIAHNWYFNRKSLEYVLKQIVGKFDIIPEQRYDLSNHITWAMEGRPGGQGKYSHFFTQSLETAYRENMVKTGYCDTLVCRIQKRF